MARLAGVPDAPAGVEHDQRQERQVDALNQPVRQAGAEGDQHTPGEPDAPQPEQAKALGSVGLGPDADRGQQEAGNRRREKTKQHFMLVPEQSGQRQRQLDGAADLQHPQRHGRQRQHRQRQEKDPERVTEQLAEAGGAISGIGRDGLHRALHITCIRSVY